MENKNVDKFSYSVMAITIAACLTMAILAFLIITDMPEVNVPTANFDINNKVYNQLTSGDNHYTAGIHDSKKVGRPDPFASYK